MADFESIITTIKGTSRGLDLDIRDNYFNDKKTASIVKLIENNPKVTRLHLWLTCNFITDRGFKEIVRAIGDNMTDLRKLNLNVDWNYHIKNKSVDYLIACLQKLSKLEDLSVRMTQ
jgi:hypothetical protein